MAAPIVLTFSGNAVSMIYDDALSPALRTNLAPERVFVRRASHVEARPDGSAWDADMSPVGGPVLANFSRRTAALNAEVRYLQDHVLFDPKHFNPVLQ